MAGDFACAVHLVHDFVGKPVGEKVHGDGHEEGEDHAGLTADSTAYEDHEHGKKGEKQSGLDMIHHLNTSSDVFSSCSGTNVPPGVKKRPLPRHSCHG